MDRLISLLEKTGLPFVYDHFAQGRAPAPPFVCYLVKGAHNFSADGKVYLPVNEVHIELYCDKKDIEAEKRIERVLADEEIFFDKTEVYIPQEHLYEVLFSFEMKG